MMRIFRISSRGKTRMGVGVIDYLMATEYYLGKDGEREDTARWIGGGAEALGLTGKVNKEDMLALTKGFAPPSAPNAGDPLCLGAGKEPTWKAKIGRDGQPMLDKNGRPKGVWEGGHRVGFDLTFSAVKSVSLLYASADDAEKARIVEAHRRAVAKVMKMVEADVESRREKGGKKVIHAQIVASGHTHFGSRAVDESQRHGEALIGDPQLHEHVLVYGVCKGEDGKWGTWDANNIYQNQRMYGALYRAEMAREIQELGYGIEKRPDLDSEGKPTGTVFYGVVGISEELCKRFSKRRQQVVEYAAAHGVSKETAALSTRMDKEEPPLPEMLDVWKKTLDGIPEMPRHEEIRGLASITEGISDKDAMARLHEGDAVWTRAQLVQRLAEENVGRMDADGVMKEADRLLREAELYHIQAMKEPGKKEPAREDGPRRFTEERYASKEWVDGVERTLLDSVASQKDNQHVRVSAEKADHAIASTEQAKGFELLPEQRRAVHHLLSETGGTAIMAGRAGTGKTTTLDAVVRAYRAEGRQVLGCATSWNAANNLRDETGMTQSYSTRQLLFDLENDNLSLTKNTVIVVDEAGMTGSRDLKDIAVAVHAAGGKLILTGDAEQLQPVEGGGGFRMLEEKIGYAELKTIRRQRDAEDLATANLFYDDTTKAGERSREEQQDKGTQIFNRLDDRNQIDHCETKEEAIEDLVSEYLKSDKPIEQKIVIAGLNSDVVFLNNAIRNGLQETGQVSTEERTFHSMEGGRARDIALAGGDRIRFTGKSKALGVVNGTRAKVVAVEEDASRMKVEITSGKHRGSALIVDTTKFKKFTYDYAGTVYKSQGQTREECYQLATVGMTDKHLSLVAATRSRGSYRLYGSEDDLEEIGERMGMDRYKSNALEEGIVERTTESKREHQPIIVDPAKVAELRQERKRERELE